MDPLAQVPLGREDTGAAIIYPSSGISPLQMHLRNLDKIEKHNAVKAAKQAEKKKKLDGLIKGLSIDRKGIFRNDVPDITKYQSDLINKYTEWNKAGVDVSDPSFQDSYNEALNIQREGEDMVIMSKEHKEKFKNAYERLNTDGDTKWDYDRSTQMIEEVSKLPLIEREQFIDKLLVPKGFNPDQFMTEFMKGFKPNVDTRLGIGEKVTTKTKTTQYSPEQIFDIGRQAMDTNEDWRDYIIGRYQRMEATDAANGTTMVSQLNQEAARLSQKGTPIDATDLLSAREFESRNYKSVDKDAKLTPGYSSGSGVDKYKDQARWLLQAAAGLQTGNPDLYYQEYENIPGPVTKPQFQEGLQAGETTTRMLSNALVGAEIGLTTPDPILGNQKNQILGFKHENGELYMQTLQSKLNYEEYSGDNSDISEWQRVDNVYLDIIAPYVNANYGSSTQTAAYIEAIKEVAREMGAWDNAGYVDSQKLMKAFGVTKTTTDDFLNLNGGIDPLQID